MATGVSAAAAPPLAIAVARQVILEATLGILDDRRPD
jgi:hypothetical protein